MRVVLIPTGKMERKALASSLQSMFPLVEFACEPPDGTPDLLLPKSFTSATLPCRVQSKAEQCVDTLVRWLLAEVEPGRKGRGRPDLVVLLEDLELANVAQPQVVRDELRRAIGRHLARLAQQRSRVISEDVIRQALQERASFHLMVPMTEAYFFGDPAALSVVTPRAGQAQLAAGVDVEQFQVDDAAYLAPLPVEAHCPRTEDSRCPWAGEDRSRHPKKYVQYLSRSASEPFCSDYKETHQGAAGLAALDWHTVLADPAAAPFARALIEDIAHAVGQPSPACGPAAATSIFGKPRPTVLRNL